ncbi:MAG TPA: tetratricopeptide repeat protein [Candidatus Acidoferrales bacterium]|nr:tetratricopeptide repeat protein [Candidatus Acidoferrales bacterium]
MTAPETNANQPQGKPKNRREMLEQFVAGHPDDAFARYGLAMECMRLGDNPAAEAHFKQLMSSHPDYVASYFPFGQMLAKLGRAAEARRILAAGVERAAATGDGHARSEMQVALDELD